MDLTLDDKLVRMRKIDPHQTHWLCCIHVMINDISIIMCRAILAVIKMLSEYGNIIQACWVVIFKHSPMESRRKHGRYTLKEEGCSDNRIIIIQKNTRCVYWTHTTIDKPVRSILTVSKGYALRIPPVYV